ncbi:ABC transporter substrate-binding protein [Rhizobium beringeri]
MNALTRVATAAILLSSTAPAAQSAEQIRILAPTWLGFAPVHVGVQNGCFTARGLDVSIKFEDDLANVMAAMARGDIEVQMRSLGEYQGRPRDKDTPGIIIGTIDESVGGDGVITDDKIASVADLKGKTVASELNIPSRLLLQAALKEAGLSLADLQIKDIATADTAAVFADESIAAIATYEPFMSQAVQNSTRSGREGASSPRRTSVDSSSMPSSHATTTSRRTRRNMPNSSPAFTRLSISSRPSPRNSRRWWRRNSA